MPTPNVDLTPLEARITTVETALKTLGAQIEDLRGALNTRHTEEQELARGLVEQVSGLQATLEASMKALTVSAEGLAVASTHLADATTVQRATVDQVSAAPASIEPAPPTSGRVAVPPSARPGVRTATPAGSQAKGARPPASAIPRTSSAPSVPGVARRTASPGVGASPPAPIAPPAPVAPVQATPGEVANEVEMFLKQKLEAMKPHLSPLQAAMANGEIKQFVAKLQSAAS